MRIRAACRIAILAVVTTLTAVGSALGDPVAGATYTATAADGATVSFTVSSDGTLLTSYRITDARGQGCQFYANGQEGEWEGAPIQNDRFAYQLGSAISFEGTFTGANSASGTFRFQDPPSPGGTPCDSGTVGWTATTGSGSAGSSSGGVGGSGGTGGASGGATGSSGSTSGGSGTGGSTSSRSRHVYLTRLGLHVLGRKVVGGRVGSPLAACRSRRPVILWVGERRLIRSHADRSGAYVFPRSPKWRGRLVRVSVAAVRTSTGATCAPASSTFIHG